MCWGPISYSIQREDNALAVTVRETCNPPGEFLLKPTAFDGVVSVPVTNLPETVRFELTDVDTRPAVVEYVRKHNPRGRLR